ncbi:hypothetical protein VOLCADRAFT_93368 [Volvox carteri f. nagariensis]|uniref:Flagellar associated protein n=1 Tax=Volvox carteri f. nagariensis TaxID=3068 RepID=D8U1Y0_VOLCA|nr:uncharacterized protein VOLCADRAFT_93368 [Volvox carteri f. nagariensis]EFJ46189.1 hypothetical protein VOLCADRAFT_93368 [Volvox carteri f. nagariensis]|eukprot:XP_002952636.1 hypothetical protein VOLCADRAFT_93368 [Volvox carteri f. nagariensis]
MADLKELYLQKCGDFACEPITPILEALNARRPLDVIALDGKTKALFNNRIKPMQVIALCETLYEYGGLSVLRLSYNFLNDMAMNSGLRMLDLTGNEATGEGAAALAGVLTRPEARLQALVLRNNPLGDAGVLEIAEMLRSNSSLTMLDLADTHCGIQGVIGISNALTDGNNTLKILDLEDAQVHAQGPQDSTYQHLIRMLAVNTSLTDLSLAKQRMTDPQFEQLVTYGFAKSRAVWTSLSLRGNRLSPFAGPALERLLSLCPRLQRLNLASNALGNDGAVSLSRCLAYCAELRELDVRSNGIGDVGLMALAGVLQLVHTMELFMVWGNNFGPGACRAMADALSHPAARRLRTDVRPYTVDGEVSLALQEV